MKQIDFDQFFWRASEILVLILLIVIVVFAITLLLS
jgi:hypothetical protein